MARNLILVLMAVVFFGNSESVRAELLINEIMYDLSASDSIASKSREWIEIYNNGGEVAVDASWRIYDGSANRTINGEVNFSIGAGEYVIFAGDRDTFLTDYSSFSGTVYDTGIASLNNTGATLKILDSEGVALDTASYSSGAGGAGDGNSLQKFGSSWSGTSPTPGAQNQASNNTNNQNDNSSDAGSDAKDDLDSSNNSTTSFQKNDGKPTLTKTRKIESKIIAKTSTLVGIPILFTTETTGPGGEKLSTGKYFWNFGDGSTRTTAGNDSFYHLYPYPGEYKVSLEYYRRLHSLLPPDDVSELTIKVLRADVVISALGDDSDFFVEIANNTPHDADISGWTLTSSKKNFTFPKNTVLSGNKKIKYAPAVTGFTAASRDTLRLMDGQWDTVAEYNAPVSIGRNSAPAARTRERSTSLESEPLALTISDVNPDLSANVFSGVEGETAGGSNYVFIIVFVVLLLGSGAGVYFLRREKRREAPGDDFEILQG